MDTQTEDSGVIALLKKHQENLSGKFDDTVLPETGIKVAWPKFQPHSTWAKAQRMAKKNPFSTTDIYLALLCTFNGERMTIAEFKQYIPTGDVLHLTGEVLGDDEDEDEGNAPA